MLHLTLLVFFRWSKATVTIAGKEFLPGHRLDANAAFLDVMTNYSKIDKGTKLWQIGYRDDTVGKSVYNK